MKADMRRCPWCGGFGGSHEHDGEAWHEDCWDKALAENAMEKEDEEPW